MTEISLRDCLRYPVWEWALDEENLPGHDESWQRPIINVADITENLDVDDPILTFRVAGSETYGSAVYNNVIDALEGLSFWIDETWVGIDSVEFTDMPVELIALPKILGSSAHFRVDEPASDTAARCSPGVPNSGTPLIRREPLAYILGGAFNGGNMCSSSAEILPGIAGLKICPRCGFRMDFEFTNPAFRIPTRRFDFSITYDYDVVVSNRFKQFCKSKNYTGLRFFPLPKSQSFFHFTVANVLTLDVDRIGLKREHLCPVCHHYREVYGLSTHYVTGLNSPLQEGIWRSDVLIGSGNMKAPILYVGSETREEMIKERLRGASFSAYP